MTIHKYHCNLS